MIRCSNCGEQTSAFAPGLTTVMALQTLPRGLHLEHLTALEDITPAVAAEWLHHHHHRSCAPKISNCPHCGAPLRTWRARVCLSCHGSVPRDGERSSR